MSDTLWFRVSARHTSPAYTCTDRLAKVERVDYGKGTQYSATVAKFGCSKAYSTPDYAIQAMLQDHACTGIEIKPLLGVAEVEAARSEWWAR